MLNLQQLRQQMQDQIQTGFENDRFYYQNQDPQVSNGFAPIDQINNFDQVKNNLKADANYVTREEPIFENVTRNEQRSRQETRCGQETRYRSVTREVDVPYQVPSGSPYCSQCKKDYVFDFPSDGMHEDAWCQNCREMTMQELRTTGYTTCYRKEKKSFSEPYAVDVSYQVDVPYTETVTRQEQTGTRSIINWQGIKQSLEQQFTQNQNEYSFIYWNINNPDNEPDLAQIYQSADRNQFKIVLKVVPRDNSDFAVWKQNVERNIRERRFNDLFSQQFQQVQDQVGNLAQERAISEEERGRLQAELESERQARANSRERRETQMNAVIQEATMMENRTRTDNRGN